MFFSAIFGGVGAKPLSPGWSLSKREYYCDPEASETGFGVNFGDGDTSI